MVNNEWIKNGVSLPRTCNHCGLVFATYQAVVQHLGKISRNEKMVYAETVRDLMKTNGGYITLSEAFALAITQEPAPHGTNMYTIYEHCAGDTK